MAELSKNNYNPDILSCIANLSNDEVFTPPEITNAMLDMLPQELFSNPDTKFLDPACKSGIFLREIAKRLIEGLKDKIPDLQERIDHIFHHQLYGIAITELTSLLSRRSVYCSKYPNSKYSITSFQNTEGNIRYKHIQHSFKNGKCVFCGASQSEYERDISLEQYAYEFIHRIKPEEIFNVKFDVIISNPPYQLSTGSKTAQAVPIYDKFVQQSIKLNPHYLVMIIPARWFAGGMGLDEFRKAMLNNKHIKKIVDFPNAKDCFTGVSLGGGVCYFLWDRNYIGPCEFTNINNRKETTLKRNLDEFPVFVRYNEAISIIRKVQIYNEQSLSVIISSLNPFNLASSERGSKYADDVNNVKLLSSKGWGYINKNSISKENKYLNKWKVAISKVTSEHAGEPDKEGKFKVFAKMLILHPNEACTFLYFLAGCEANENFAKNIFQYLQTKFARFLLLQSISSINITKDKFRFVPIQDFSKPWSDEELYKKYNLTKEEIAFIESMIKPMELGGDENGD